MLTSEVSEYPVLKELKTLVDHFPSPNDPKFDKCRGALNSGERKCDLPIGKGKQKEIEELWGNFKEMRGLPDDNKKFYLDVERFLKLIHCSHHGPKALDRFNDWKQPPVVDLSYASSEASPPSTPEQSSLFDSPTRRDVTPLSSPLTEDDTPRTPSKSPSSDIYSFIQDTPSKIIDRNPVFIADNEERITADVDTKDVSIVTINATLPTLDTSSNTENPDAFVESITEISVTSSQEPSKVTTTVATKEVVIEQASAVVVEDAIAQQNNPFVGNNLVNQQGTYVAGIGYGFPKRQGSLRDDSPIIREFYKYLTPDQHKEGRVYILKHKEHDNIFKIGFTKVTASERNLQSKNCYGENTEIIYESHTPFPGAMKAERLAQVSLKNENLHITHCNMCGHGHREWFRGTRKTILNKVKVMEKFVRLPAYEFRDGEMKLSLAGGFMVKAMCNFSAENFETAITGYKESNRIEVDSREGIEAKAITTAQIAVTEVTVEVPFEPVEREESPCQAETLPSTDSTQLRPSMGTKFGRVVGGARKSINHVKDKLQHLRSRETTPESDGAQDELDTWKRAEELMTGLLWSIVPENSKPENCFKEDEGPRELSSLKNALEQTFTKFKEDFLKAARVKAEATSGL